MRFQARLGATRGALLAGLLALVLSACSDAPDLPPPSPALWHVTGDGGAEAYLFGTAHSLPAGTRWRTREMEAAFAACDTLVVEVSALTAPQEMRAIFSRLATTPGQPPLAERVSPEERPLIARVMAAKGLRDADYAEMETWAVALALSRLAEEGSGANGVDLALLKDAGRKRVVELEGAERQLALFDALPQAEQADLLEAVARELDHGASAGEQDHRLRAWITGDLAGLEEETRHGLLADPELREALLVRRNADWAERLDQLLRGGGSAFVAVGAAHLVGPDGLPELLAARGYTVRRVQ